MSIETLIPQGDLNIKDFSIEQPDRAQANFFDPEKEIKEEEWKEIERVTDEGVFLRNKISRLAAIKLINPSMFSRLNVGDERYRKWVEEAATEESSLVGRINIGANLKIIFPEKDVSQNLLQNDHEEIIKIIKIGIDNYNFYTLFKYRILFPKDDLQAIFGDDLLEAIKTKGLGVENMQTLLDNCAAGSLQWTANLRNMAILKLMFPDLTDKLNINKEILTSLKKYISSNGDLSLKVWNIAYAKILTMPGAKLTENGIEFLDLPEDLLSIKTDEPFPAVKKF